MLERFCGLGTKLYWLVKPHLMNQLEVMRQKEYPLEEIVEKYPMITASELKERAFHMLTVYSTKQSIAELRESEHGQNLIRLTVQRQIDALYPFYPKIAARLDRELNPDI